MKDSQINSRKEFAQLRRKMYFRFLFMGIVAFMMIMLVYMMFWKGRGGDAVVQILQNVFGMSHNAAMTTYQHYFRNQVDLIWMGSTILIFLALFYLLLHYFTEYLVEVNQGISALLDEKDSEIHLSAELLLIERKLNTVKQALKRRTLEAQLAEQRKNDLVMYLAHDIRTPLTSVIGYLSLLEEAPDMPVQQKAKYVHITLDKAYRLEKMINEFFEITRYNLKQISLEQEDVDLYYMLVQVLDELSPVLSQHGNTTRLLADENLRIYGDPERLARVFNNVLKNAAVYSYPNTEITICAKKQGQSMKIVFENQGKKIPPEKLTALFEKFYRLEEARTSHTGGTGLGLAIAKEIVALHGGTITAESEENKVRFVISLPVKP